LKHYALIFHTPRPLTPADPEKMKQRGIDIAAWVKRVTETGIALDPRNFGEMVANFAPEGSEVVSRKEPTDPTFATIVFFDSPSREQAVNIARTHPGLRYGVTVEVREWTSPRETMAKSQQ
jgi:hypothetical protein